MYDKAPIFYYINNDGMGHLKRALAIASKLQQPIYLLCAFDIDVKTLPANTHVLKLPVFLSQSPMKSPPASWKHKMVAEHCVPFYEYRQAERAKAIVNYTLKYKPKLAIVDVCVETASLFRLCGVPVMYCRMHGNRLDQAHQNAYHASIGLIASYPKAIESQYVEPWMVQKTIYPDGWLTTSETTEQPHRFESGNYDVVTLCSRGSHGFTKPFLEWLSTSFPKRRFDVIGSHGENSANLRYHGWVGNSTGFIKQANVVIGTAGNNTVSEILKLKKPFICLPQPRPFDEQFDKASVLDEKKLAFIIHKCDQDVELWAKALEFKPDSSILNQLSRYDGANCVAKQINDMLNG